MSIAEVSEQRRDHVGEEEDEDLDKQTQTGRIVSRKRNSVYL